ncbi:CCA tRNA nucleotidyltransferase [Nitratifractor sp.]
MRSDPYPLIHLEPWGIISFAYQGDKQIEYFVREEEKIPQRMKHTFLFPHFFSTVSPQLKIQIEKVRVFLESEYSARCCLVGGAVRDRLLGRPVKDLDIEVYGLDPETFAEAMARLGASGVGKSFFVYKYGDLDIALPRREKKVGRGHRGFVVEPARDEREASRRRDFTVNALMYDLRSERIVDYWRGLEDLRAKRLRRVDPKTFVEDSLRVLRAMQFAARLGFRVEEETCRLCRRIPLDDLPGSRIFGEFEKMFTAERPHYGLYALETLEISRRLWGKGLKSGAFVRAARAMARRIPAAPEPMRPYCFLALYAQYSPVPMSEILEAIDAPNRYRRLLEALPKVPPNPTPAFVADCARKTGLKESPLSCFPSVRRIAQRLGIWERPFEIGVSPRELMERGFSGKALGEELERIRRRKLAALERKEP